MYYKVIYYIRAVSDLKKVNAINIYSNVFIGCGAAWVIFGGLKAGNISLCVLPNSLRKVMTRLVILIDQYKSFFMTQSN